MGPATAAAALQENVLDTGAQLRREPPETDRNGATVAAAVVTKLRPAQYNTRLAHYGCPRA
eukprot:5830013-Lingulodinium_polyedra.AAC.1